MTFEKLYKRNNLPFMTDYERGRASILVIEPELTVKKNLRQTLQHLGYGHVSEASDHLQGIKKIQEQPFSHIIFEAKKTTMPPLEFLAKALELDSNVTAMAASWDPNLDDVFNLLCQGAKGYLVKPFTQNSVDEAIVMATKGEPISDSILYAKDRNEALASLIMTALDKLAVAKRQALQFETAEREIPRRKFGFERALDIGQTFANGGRSALLESLMEFCIERSNGPATQLGRLRKRLEARKPRPVPKIEESTVPKDNDPSVKT